MLIADSTNTAYLLRFDPPAHLELSTGAAMISSRLIFALGYWVPQHYIVYFRRSDLRAAPDGEELNDIGDRQKLREEDIDSFLDKVPKDDRKGYRALVLRADPGMRFVGPYQFFDRRSDDPNDIVPHEHRRDLRGLHVISSWINNNWISAVQTQDALVTENGRTFFRHMIVDFFGTLGSGDQMEKHPREGNEPFIDFRQAAKNFAGFGLFAPKWQRARWLGSSAVGNFEFEAFDPAKWYPNYSVAALANRLRDDDYWAAKKILTFTDEDIRAIVKTAEYSDPKVESWIAMTLIERRNKVGRFYLSRVLPLENFRIVDGEVEFDDLAVEHKYRGPLALTVEWFTLDNLTGELTPIVNAPSRQVPERAFGARDGSYFAAKISQGQTGNTVTAYFRGERGELKLAGIDRDWPGKLTAEVKSDSEAPLPNSYSQLRPRQRELFDRYTERYASKTGSKIAPADFFAAHSVSERTTFEAVTHALLETHLSSQNGQSLGVALDLVEEVERIAGQYYGRQGDEQFRLYCRLRDDARDLLEQSRQFYLSGENTVYHAGYSDSYRQVGKVPNMQFSISGDGHRADIDVDYRSSKKPQALWNGHLTAANSDVRAGNNYNAHNRRWAGLMNWWQEILGKLPSGERPDQLLATPVSPTPTPLPPNRPPGAEIIEVYNAAKEFLADWLVRRNYDEAMAFVSRKALACVRLDDDARPHEVVAEQARRQLRANLEAISERAGKFESLTPVIEAEVPWRQAFRLVDQPFSKEFALVHAPEAFAKAFACQDRSDAALTKALDDPNPQYADVYGVIFRFRAGELGGVLGLLWIKENGRWKIESWKIYDQ
jgi:hypothetical protein